jgi:hypothetical protein
LRDDKGLVGYLARTEIILEQFGNDEVEDVGISYRHDSRHLGQCATLPVCIQLLLLQAHTPSAQFPIIAQDCTLEIVDKLHHYNQISQLVASALRVHA